MGAVTKYIQDLVSRQVKDKGIVVWFDPEKHYSSVLDDLEASGMVVARYDGSFFALRHGVDHLLDSEEPPKLIVYVPMLEEQSQHALIELTSAGVIMKPGQSPWQRNTRLTVIAKAALEGAISERELKTVEGQVVKGQITSVAELDRLAGSARSEGVVHLIFNSSDPEQIALIFLMQAEDSKILAKVVEREALAALVSLLQEAFGHELPDCSSVSECQATFARYVLMTDFLASLGDLTPTSLSAVPRAKDQGQVEKCVDVANTWRSRIDGIPSYERWSGETEKTLAIANLDFSLEQLSKSMTFLAGERALQNLVAEQMVKGTSSGLVDLAVERQSGYWATNDPEIQARWAMTVSAGRLLIAASEIDGAIGKPEASARSFVDKYVKGDDPWCLLDTHHRHMERHYQMLDFSAGDPTTEALDRLALHARRLYMGVGGRLAESFVHALSEDSFQIPGYLRQSDVYRKVLSPSLSQGKAVYLLVDALRYETALELAAGVTEDFEVDLNAAVAAVPTITEIGMAALMPGTGEKPELVSTDKGRVGYKVGDRVLKDKNSRLRFLRDNIDAEVRVFKLDNIYPSPRKKTEEAISSADLIIVTSQEIDEIGELDSSMARQAMEQVPRQIGRSCRILADLGVRTIVVVSDHGYLFGEEIADDVKIDAPGGQTADLHRRVWVGKGGVDNPSTIRVKAEDVGYGGDLEMVAPRGFGVFKSPGGGTSYFHGGFSLQEIIVPVLKLVPKKQEVQEDHHISWGIVPGSKKISTRFFAAKIVGQAGLFSSVVPRTRLELRSGGKVISQPVSASYGFDETAGTVQLGFKAEDDKTMEPNTVTLMIDEIPSDKTASLHLLDALSGRELARVEGIDVSISI